MLRWWWWCWAAIIHLLLTSAGAGQSASSASNGSNAGLARVGETAQVVDALAAFQCSVADILQFHPGLLDPPLQLLSPPVLLGVSQPPGSVDSSGISLVCTAAPFPPGVADAVGGGRVGAIVSPGQRLEVGLHEPL